MTNDLGPHTSDDEIRQALKTSDYPEQFAERMRGDIVDQLFKSVFELHPDDLQAEAVANGHLERQQAVPVLTKPTKSRLLNYDFDQRLMEQVDAGFLNMFCDYGPVMTGTRNGYFLRFCQYAPLHVPVLTIFTDHVRDILAKLRAEPMRGATFMLLAATLVLERAFELKIARWHRSDPASIVISRHTHASGLFLTAAERKDGWVIETINGTTVKILRDELVKRALLGK